MNTLSAQAMMQAWELAQGHQAARRPLVLLHQVWPEVAPAHWGSLPLGERDRWLLALRERLFGPELDTVADCTACGETLQLNFATGELLGSTQAPLDGAPEPLPTSETSETSVSTLQFEGWTLSYRLPGTDDLSAVLADAADDRERSIACLLERCVEAAHHDGSRVAASQLPSAVIDRLQDEMARRDPLADSRVALQCPACGHHFERRFDIGAYLWDELDDWAERTLVEVHQLALAYGWSEPQTLSLSADRRQRYLSMVQG